MYFGRSRAERAQAARDFLIGCSLVSLMYVDVWRLLLSAVTPYSFFLTYSRTHYLAAIATVVLGGVCMTLLAPVVRRASTPTQYAACLIFLMTIVVVLDELRKANAHMWPSVMGVWTTTRGTVGLPVLAVAAVIAVALALRYVIPLTKLYRRALLVMSVFAAFVVVRGAWALGTLDFDAFHPLARKSNPGLPAAHRVVIVIFDELDNEIALTRRPADLRMPHFDAFRKAAVTFDSAYPPGPNTIESMPSYLLGAEVDSLIPIDANSFAALLKNGDRTLSDSARSIFSDPAGRGARTAVVGYALPYCRLGLTAMVDACESIALVGDESGNMANAGFLRAMSQQLRSLVPFNSRRTHIARLRVAIDHATDFAADSRYSLVLLHLPVPHSPWIWDRHANRFRVDILGEEGYLGNLVLADRILGRMRDEMTKRGTWDETTLIVTTDHSWRSKPNRTDRRIPLMIKLPGMNTPDTIMSPTNALVVSTLVPDLIDARIQDPATLRRHVAGFMTRDSTLLQREPRRP